jgi:hypothetical protein
VVSKPDSLRGVKILVFGMLVVIAVLAVVLFAELARRLIGGGGEIAVLDAPPVDRTAEAADLRFPVPEGARIVQIAGTERHALVLLEWPDGRQELRAVDPALWTADSP